ncbi:MAG: hypothetical protein LBN95_03020 [Prevotellaceae bacterium]|jgi:hypothetical protein|nr:hypothetical protein [Prevotellaceae bacterium]
MKKHFLFAAVAVFGLLACQKTEVVDNNLPQKQKTPQQEEKIPIAKVTESGDIELLFLQKDVKDAFEKEMPDLQLVFVDIKDQGLLYKIYDKLQGVREISISHILTFDGGVCYAPSANTFQYAGGGSSSWTITCTTSDKDCAAGQFECFPNGTACTQCLNGATCTKSISDSSLRIVNLVKAINVAALAYYR